ncbi:MAG TPA: hypothetical protein H9790_03195 [Candidatus Agathobaculum intestinipullorum]|nr:hypothetical protein [Candidatus Agathobaculum intestinipullorum]
MVEYLLEQLMDLFHTDLTYFADRVPVVKDIGTIFFAVGWALLIGNLVIQAMRSMASGVGIEAEEPGRLFLRTAMFSFLLMVSRQICEIGLGFSSTIMDMLQIPNAITFDPFGEDTFDMLPNAGWIVVILVNVIIQWQTIKLFFEVAERYVILCVLTYCAPLAFAMGGSKSTGEIFRGWLRMFASMCALMVFNLMFVKLLISAMSNAPNGTAIIPWMMLIVGIVRMAKKMDGIILRIGLNPALTGDPLGTRFPGMLTAMTLRSIAQMVARTAAQGMPSAGYGSPAPPASGAFMQHGGKQGSQSTSTVGASAQGGAAAGAAGVAGAAIHVAGSGARAMNDLASFRNRHGAGDPASIRQVSQAISVDADDWEDGSSVSSIRSQNQSVSEANAVSRMMVSPVSPAIPPLAADFGRLGAPQTESALCAPVMPPHRTDTAPGLSVTPVQPVAAMPRTPEQVFPSNTGTSGAPQQAVSGTPSAHPPVQPTTSRPARVTPVSPVSPSHVQTLLHSESNLSEVRTGYTEQNAPENQPVSPVEPVGHSSGVVPAAAVAAATAAQGYTASAVQPNRTAPSGSASLAVSPPSRTMPPAPPVQQVMRQTGVTADTDGGSIRVTPVVPQPQTTASTSGQSTHRSAVQPVSQTAVQPPSPAVRTQAPTAPAVSPVSADGGRRPAVSPATPAPNRRTAVSPSRREHSEIQQTTTAQSNVTTSVRPPDMVGRPQIADKTRRLRRSAQPLNNKVTPQEGGKHHKRRKKK